MKSDEGGLRKLDELARAEYGVPLTELVSKPLWYPRLERLAGVLIKEPFAEARPVMPQETGTASRRQWLLEPESLDDPQRRDSWQYRLLENLADDRRTTPRALAEEAQHERGFYAQVSAAIGSELCADELTKAEIERLEPGLRTTDGTPQVLTPDRKLTKAAKRLESLLSRKLPSLHPDLVTAYTLIIGLAGIDQFCDSANRGPSELQIEGKRPVSPDPGPGNARDHTRGFFAGMALLWLLLAAGAIFFFLRGSDQFATGVVPFLVYTLTGLGAASFLFGAMRSYGKFRGEALGMALELGGPAALFAGMLGLGMYLSYNEGFSGHAYVYDKNTKNLVSAGGTLTLQVDNAGPQNFAVTNGHATVTLERQPRGALPCDLRIDGYQLDKECSFSGHARVEFFVIPMPPPPQAHSHLGSIGALFDHLQAKVPDSEFSLDLAPPVRRDLRDIWIEPEISGGSWGEVFTKICRSYPCLSCSPPAGQITTRLHLDIGNEGVKAISDDPRRLTCGRS